MGQLDLFGSPSEPANDSADWWDFLPEESEAFSYAAGARYYQRECVDAFFEKLPHAPRQLAVLATGLGKTYIAGMLARRWMAEKRAPILALAHRDELIEQLRQGFELGTNELVEIEQAELQSSERAQIVVGSVQSFNPNRLARLGRDRFSLIITDEAHHSPAPSYQRVYEWFNAPWSFGLTATPDRKDKRAMGRSFDDTTMVFDIRQGVDAGFLVRPRPANVTVEEIDISHVTSSASTEGGFNLSELDDAMMRAVEGIVHKTLELAPERRGIWFWPGLRCAEYACQRVNALRPGSSTYIDGKMDKQERRALVAKLRSGELRHLHNFGIATEGFDWPDADLVVHGRPVKSRSLHAQMDGRGTRVLRGLVDDLTERDQAKERRARIAASSKPDLVCVDFVGNHGRHQLVTTLDVLGGSYTDAEVKAAKKKLGDGSAVDGFEALEAARRELRALANSVQGAKVKATVQWVDAFAAFGLRVDPKAEEAAIKLSGEQAATPKQRDYLVSRGLSPKEAAKLSKVSASRMIQQMIDRDNQRLATYKQLRELANHGVTMDAALSFERAKAGLNYCRQKGGQPNHAQLNAILYHSKG